ncbi:MAG: PadR family transcriptional regulator [Nanoarchaeota archaeon]
MHQTHLKLYLLHCLSEAPLSGYGLMAMVQRHSGNRPSPGTIYPLLAELEKEGLITVKEQGKRRINTVTPAGRKAFRRALLEKKALFDRLIKDVRLVGLLCPDDETVNYFIEYIRKTQEGKDPLGKSAPIVFTFRHTLLRTILREDFPCIAPKLKRILTDATAELNRL